MLRSIVCQTNKIKRRIRSGAFMGSQATLRISFRFAFRRNPITTLTSSVRSVNASLYPCPINTCAD